MEKRRNYSKEHLLFNFCREVIELGHSEFYFEKSNNNDTNNNDKV